MSSNNYDRTALSLIEQLRNALDNLIEDNEELCEGKDLYELGNYCMTLDQLESDIQIFQNEIDKEEDGEED